MCVYCATDIPCVVSPSQHPALEQFTILLEYGNPITLAPDICGPGNAILVNGNLKDLTGTGLEITCIGGNISVVGGPTAVTLECPPGHYFT